MFEHYTKYKDAKTAVGVWDFSRAPFKLGNALLFNQNLHLVKEFTNSKNVELAVLCDLEGDFCNQRIGPDNYRSYLSDLMDYWLLMDTVTSFRIFTARREFQEYLCSAQAGGSPVFPPYRDDSSHPSVELDYKSYLLNKEFSELKGRLSFSKIHDGAMQKARGFLTDRIPGQHAVAVHLRFDASHRTESNADLRVWERFFEASADCYPKVSFVLVGNDRYPRDFDEKTGTMANVLRTRDHNVAILQELAIIQASMAFIGMASGPSNIAILGERPYLIVKHPEDAWAERFNEVENNERFAFALPDQFFRITRESPEMLGSYVGALL